MKIRNWKEQSRIEGYGGGPLWRRRPLLSYSANEEEEEEEEGNHWGLSEQLNKASTPHPVCKTYSGLASKEKIWKSAYRWIEDKPKTTMMTVIFASKYKRIEWKQP